MKSTIKCGKHLVLHANLMDFLTSLSSNPAMRREQDCAAEIRYAHPPPKCFQRRVVVGAAPSPPTTAQVGHPLEILPLRRIS